MRYHYNSLGPDRFQEFCQALLVSQFPNVQCLPVGQPDGGRDAFTTRYLAGRRRRGDEREVIVFQVKFSRAPGEDRDERKFLEAIVASELPKIKKLKLSGLDKYYLLTNVGGTAHPGGGSIDKMNAYLSEALGVEAFCWWRDDLDRRLDNNSDVKWSYPDLLKATDLLQGLMTGVLGESEERRRAAMQAYIASQYEDDEDLKFKQVDLQSNMVGLYVDLPIAPKRESADFYGGRGRPKLLVRHLEHALLEDMTSVDLAANFFLNNNSGRKHSRIVLEGAPGQGKSTVTQYICQIMRMHLLGKAVELSQVPKIHSRAKVRMPFRLDLRDFAKWMTGVDPFQSKPTSLPNTATKSLEGFLAAHVHLLSGGHEFNVSDLSAVIKASHVLIALDGFDEVAEIEIRNQLIAEITKATTRLRNTGGHSVQVIVTSRPAAFAKSSGFPQDDWLYVELLSLERSQVDEYAKKWMKAKGLRGIEKNDLQRTLDGKLDEPHTQFLARNPMQLTILLALVYQRGESLPEKRTSMYDAYMDLFFNREAEKSRVVRDHRELLIDIHRYLAWQLQTSAEGGASGSIEDGELQSTLLSYLAEEGEDTAIVEDLFNGVVERVGALVSRVQGTYEFEVQPLREYFVARFLYDTAPYSPAGSEKVGTKLDRLNALVRNPYWLNVARFYAGCFSKGEISALVDALVDVASTAPYELTSHPRNLALILLGDWVFTQYQPAVRRMVELIGQRPQLRLLLGSHAQADSSAWAVLPDRCGKADLMDILFDRLEEDVSRDERFVLGSVLKRNLSLKDRVKCWMAVKNTINTGKWIALGDSVGVYSHASDSQILLGLGDLKSQAIGPLLRNGRYSFLSADPDFNAQAEKLLLDGRRVISTRNSMLTDDVLPIAALAEIISPLQYQIIFREDANLSARDLRNRRTLLPSNSENTTEEGANSERKSSLSQAQRDAVSAYNYFLDLPSDELATSLQPWSALVETLRRTWGDAKAIDRIAIIASHIRSKEDVGAAPNGIFDAKEKLVERFRFARLKSGAPRWWEKQLNNTDDPEVIEKLVLMIWVFATKKTLFQLSDKLSAILESFDATIWRRVTAEFNAISNGFIRNRTPIELSEADLERAKSLSPRAVVFVGRRIDMYSRNKLVKKCLIGYEGPDDLILQFEVDVLTAPLSSKPPDYEAALPVITRALARGKPMAYARMLRGVNLSEDVATVISKDPESYPLSFVANADAVLTAKAGAEARSLSEVATSEKWFETAK